MSTETQTTENVLGGLAEITQDDNQGQAQAKRASSARTAGSNNARQGQPAEQKGGDADTLSDSQTDNEILTDDDIVTVPVLNEKTNRYELQKVPVEKAVVITAGMMTTGAERMGAAALQTDKYNGVFNYFWAHKDRTHPATNDALARGYRPHAANERSAIESHGHQVENVPGWGECITHGDMVLVACPKMAAIARDEAYSKRRADERAMMVDAGKRHIEEQFDGRVQADDGKTGFIDNTGFREGRQVLTGDLDGEHRAMQAEALAKAQEYANREARSSVSFGGFQGREGFNNAVPESPLLRRLVREQSRLATGG